MLTSLISKNAVAALAPKEGDLYKKVTVADVSFELYYGYYEEFERHSPFNEPMPIYPDLIKEPRYTANGTPVVTAMQDICTNYEGSASGDSCAECIYFNKHEELFGLCTCPARAKPSENLEVVQSV